MTTNPFAEEWRKCLKEHYKYVVRQQDAITRKSLTPILLSQAVGFTESDLQQLYIEATMHVDHNPTANTLPNPDVVKSDAQPPTTPTFQTHPSECTCELCSPIQADIDALLETGHDDQGQPLPPEEQYPDDEQDKPNQQQMSLF